MVDVAAIAGALGSIKAASDIANGMLKLHDAKALQEKTIELNRIILSAQADAITANGAQMELVAQIRALEEEVVQFKNWEADKSRYSLTNLAPGVVAFEIKEAMRNGEPLHHICANCCASGKKSYLQQHIRGSTYSKFKCNTCGEELAFNIGEQRRRNQNPSGRGGGGPSTWMGA
jgi:hypothetical protein